MLKAKGWQNVVQGFFAEHEIITREGIRDNVDWLASKFEFCGEAADGQMALPLLRTAPLKWGEGVTGSPFFWPQV